MLTCHRCSAEAKLVLQSLCRSCGGSSPLNSCPPWIAVQGLALNAPALGRQLSFLDNVAMVIVGAFPGVLAMPQQPVHVPPLPPACRASCSVGCTVASRTLYKGTWPWRNLSNTPQSVQPPPQILWLGAALHFRCGRGRWRRCLLSVVCAAVRGCDVCTRAGALRSLCPTAQLIPSTPWPLLSDDDEVPRRANGDAAYFNGACRIVTAYSIATVSCTPTPVAAWFRRRRCLCCWRSSQQPPRVRGRPGLPAKALPSCSTRFQPSSPALTPLSSFNAQPHPLFHSGNIRPDAATCGSHPCLCGQFLMQART